MALTDFKSRVVNIGDVPLGGNYPIRIQSMTSTNTMDTIATVEQSIRMIEAGCEYVRITAPGIKEAKNLRIIKKELKVRGYETPLIADIHYQPKAALIAAKYVEKVRINPGNYIDRKRGKSNFTEVEYNEEIDKIRDRLKPLIDVCKQHGTVIRIGSNHGSLSERILFRYGNTPTGMVESALEFVKICEDFGYQDLVLSMKASNVKVMVQANRLLVRRIQELGMNYPIHLGVTEAGDAEDGRMKSAAGIGLLLLDGIGDTIRVSLTEDPEFEIPVARDLVHFTNIDTKIDSDPEKHPFPFDLYQYSRRKSEKIMQIGNGKPPVVIVNQSSLKSATPEYKDGFEPDYIFNEKNNTLKSYTKFENQISVIFPVYIDSLNSLKNKVIGLKTNDLLVFSPAESTCICEIRNWFIVLFQNGLHNPVILQKKYPGMPLKKILIKATIEFSCFLVDGLLDGIWIQSEQVNPEILCETAFGILQATGERISKPDYIACPSCGRTRFNIQDTLKVIKQRTSHLKGLKIGVMGCDVNGPGEMADAHYGYVGTGKGKITLYKGKQIIKTGIMEEFAVDELIKLIKENGDWD